MRHAPRSIYIQESITKHIEILKDQANNIRKEEQREYPDYSYIEDRRNFCKDEQDLLERLYKEFDEAMEEECKNDL